MSREARPGLFVYGELTKRQKEVLLLSAKGFSRKEIAVKLFVSVETIKAHQRSIRQRLDAKTTTEAVAIALRKGLIT